MIDTEKVIEILECAKFNCNNIKKVGLVMIEVIKEQIQCAIDLLEAADEKDE